MKKPISPQWDPWDAWNTIQAKRHYELTSIEFTVTNLCNLRCEHCAVGETLLEKDMPFISLSRVFERLDEVESLQTISLTGGEPVFHSDTVEKAIKPILQYAKNRGIYTQLNTNLTLPYHRYDGWIEDVDVVHISYNYRDFKDFHRMVYAKMDRTVSAKIAEKTFTLMKDNAKRLAEKGVFVSAETFLSPFTAPYILDMHHEIVHMGCKRHEVHPLYPSDFAKGMSLLSLEDYRRAVELLIQEPQSWILFGTLPFFPCSDNKRDQNLWMKLHDHPNVTVRQDPDGRNRLNINLFTGNVTITDFAELQSFGNIIEHKLVDIFHAWLDHPLAKQLHCFCPAAKCTGPNLLVKDSYYPEWNFVDRKSHIQIG
jgi:radical SAM/CxCxxxxC motif protein YfkAB